MSILLICLFTFLATVALVRGLRPVAIAVGLVDVPNERKSHNAPTPLVGGLAIFLALVTALLTGAMAGWLELSRPLLSYLAGGALLVLVGVIDDRHELSPLARFLAQIVAALVMVFGGGVVLQDLGTMTFSGRVLELGLFAIPFTVFATLGVINALNMCDGLDGLSGSLALVSILGLGAAGLFWGGADIVLLALLAAAIAGFLAFNLRLPGRERASVFMGDAGSMFIGFTLTWFAISLSQGEARAFAPAAALWFVMLPVIDAVAMMLRRILRGRSPFAPDREHLHHVFQLAGYSVNQTVGIMVLIALGGVAVALASVQYAFNELTLALGFLALGLLYFWMIMRAWRVMRFVRRSICRRRDGRDRRHQARVWTGPERRSGRDRRQDEAHREGRGRAAGGFVVPPEASLSRRRPR
ncbi:MAG: undecaprenyl-phosphate alpha-N-acetylglucosaminyl 1-phosphate transferase [Chromatiales bacterium]|nr:undecaprenyl-phosphate alpha-N-acetylglucosaminyl 1-phosphate transferase [Chromatiales bacterium]